MCECGDVQAWGFAHIDVCVAGTVMAPHCAGRSHGLSSGRALEPESIGAREQVNEGVSAACLLLSRYTNITCVFLGKFEVPDHHPSLSPALSRRLAKTATERYQTSIKSR